MFFINQTLVRRREMWKSARLGLPLAVRLLGTFVDKSSDADSPSDSPIRRYNDDEWSIYRRLGFQTPLHTHRLDRGDEEYFMGTAYKRWNQATDLRSFYRRSLHSRSGSNGQLFIPCTIKELKRHNIHPWDDSDLALAHPLYRQLGKDIICNVIFRFLNAMSSFCMYPNPFCSDMIEELRLCGSVVGLIELLKKQLEELFPPVAGKNYRIREDFIKDVNKLVEQESEMEENMGMLRNLLQHPLLHSINWRSSFICRSYQSCRSHQHQVGVKGNVNRQWQYTYHQVAVDEDADRLGSLDLVELYHFKEQQLAMKIGVNHIIEDHLDDKAKIYSRAGHFELFRHGLVHINEHTPEVINQGVVSRNLHYHMGSVSLDCKAFYNARVKKVDYLEAIPFIMEGVRFVV